MSRHVRLGASPAHLHGIRNGFFGLEGVVTPVEIDFLRQDIKPVFFEHQLDVGIFKSLKRAQFSKIRSLRECRKVK